MVDSKDGAPRLGGEEGASRGRECLVFCYVACYVTKYLATCDRIPSPPHLRASMRRVERRAFCYNLFMKQTPENEPSDFQNELLEMAGRDQEMRERAREHSDLYDENVDKENTKRLGEMVDEIGWPTPSKVGSKAARAAWLIAQHADYNPEFQEKCLELLQDSKDADIDPSDIAYLTDRVRVNTGRKQLYGTQFNENNEPHPIENPDELDVRRNEAGMDSFEEYKKLMDSLNSNAE